MKKSRLPISIKNRKEETYLAHIQEHLAEDIKEFEKKFFSAKRFKVDILLAYFNADQTAHLARTTFDKDVGFILVRLDALLLTITVLRKIFKTSLRSSFNSTPTIQGVIRLSVSIGGLVILFLSGVVSTFATKIIIVTAFVYKYINEILSEQLILVSNNGNIVLIIASFYKLSVLHVYIDTDSDDSRQLCRTTTTKKTSPQSHTLLLM